MAGRQPRHLTGIGELFFAKTRLRGFAISYRLSKPGAKTFPGAVYDVKAAVQFVRANAARFGIDPDRIGLMGDSAGAHLAALVALCRRRAPVLDRVPQRSARRHGRERASR
jgi:acetyl esterase/lipase